MKKIFTHFRSILLMAMALLVIATPAWTQTTIFLFEFENTEAVTTDNAVGTPTFSTVGTLTTASYFGGVQANCTTTGGSARSHAGWDAGDAYRFTVNTTGYSSLNFSSCIRSSNTNVNNFTIRASTDLMTWTTIVTAFTPGTGFASRGGALPATFDNQSTVYIEVYKTDNAGAAGNNIRIDNALLTGTPLCSITAITVSNISACDGKNTHDTSDDTFTADVTVTFANPPNTGNLVLSGDGSASVAVGSLSTATSHTFVGVTMPADGGAIGLTATFSADMPCTFTNNNAGTAPASCSPTCNDGIQNGDETGVDCGGATCPACPLPVGPILECVRLNNDGSYTAVFGYLNENAGTVVIPVGVNNGLNPNTQNGLLPTTFLPGRQVAAFEIPFDGNNLVWTLQGPDGISRTVTASANSSACPPDCPSLMANIGDACDDGDPNTVNDAVDSNCNCVGTPIMAGGDITLSLSSLTDTVRCGDTLIVAVNIEGFTNIGSLDFSVNFNDMQLRYLDVIPTDLGGETPLVGEPGVGMVPTTAITYGWVAGAVFPVSVPDGTTILLLRFIQLTDNSTTIIALSDTPTPRDASDDSFGSVTVNYGPDLAIEGSPVQPPLVATAANSFCYGDANITPGLSDTGVSVNLASGQSTNTHQVVWVLTAAPANSVHPVGAEFTVANCGDASADFAELSVANNSLSIHVNTTTPTNNGNPVYGVYTFQAYIKSCAADCESTRVGTFSIAVNESPVATVTAAESPICAGENAVFNLTGSPSAEVTFNLNSDNDQTVNLNSNGDAIVTVNNAMISQTLNLVSVRDTATNCTESLTGSATIMVNPLPVITTTERNQEVCEGMAEVLYKIETNVFTNEYMVIPQGMAASVLKTTTNANNDDFIGYRSIAGENFVPVESIDGNPIPDGTYRILLKVRNSATGCVSDTTSLRLTVYRCEITIEDPCVCKNNATTLEDGQFDDAVEIVGPSGQTWTVTQVSGLFNSNSPAPPAAPTDDLLGATFSESDNGDGTSTYTLTGIHVDALGYTLTASNGEAERSVGNICYYPNPVITGLDAIYCEDEPAVLLTGTVDRGDGQTAATPVFAGFDILSGQMVVQDNAQAFNPQMLGAGLYTVRYTVQAADEGSTEMSPNMFVGFPGCVQAVTQFVQVDPQAVINPLQPQTICSTKRLNLADVFNGIEYNGDATELVYTWALLEADADGTLNDTDPTDPTAGTYTPGAADILRGSVTLVLTVDNPDDACEPVSAQVRITIQRVDCGQFPWGGND